MASLYIIGQHQPVSTLSEQFGGSIHPAYNQFLAEYGEGEVGQLLMVTRPDSNYLRDNFSGHMDMWGLEGEAAEELLNATTVARSIDGDIIMMLANAFAVLPRHSEEPLRFADFDELLAHYGLINAVFDPYPDYQQEYINLVKNGILDKALVADIYQRFILEYNFDKVLNEDTQPRYILQEIGGWVFFDLVYKSAIRVKYQAPFHTKAYEVVNWIKNAAGLIQ